MWESVEFDLGEVPEPTTSVWRHPSGALVGVMRPELMSPPYLWFQLGAVSPGWLRAANDDLDELQWTLCEPVLLAESDDNEVARRFLRFLNFGALGTTGLFLRSL